MSLLVSATAYSVSVGHLTTMFTSTQNRADVARVDNILVLGIQTVG